MYKDNPEFEHLDWLVHSRSKNQNTSLKIYRMMTAHKNFMSIDSNSAFTIESLAAANFSLWRAVFLTDYTAEERWIPDAEKFMHNLIANNTVGYAQDKAARTWTFHYYVDNARFRLNNIKKNQRSEFVSASYQSGKSFDLAQDWWTYHHQATTEAADRLAAYLLAKSLPS